MYSLRQVGLRLAARPCLTRAFSSSPPPSSSASSTNSYQTLRLVEFNNRSVVQVELNRPDKSNAMNKVLWTELRECFQKLAQDGAVRAIVVTGAGKNFTAGIDLNDFSALLLGMTKDPSRNAIRLLPVIRDFQLAFTAIEKCPQPVIAAVHGACIGGGIDLITACDIRHTTESAYYSVKEVDLGLAADVGTLQRLPKVIGNQSLVRELCFTGRTFTGIQAKEYGLVSQVVSTQEELLENALKLASEIASKSPVAVSGTKINLNYARDHTVDESLEFVAHWNIAMLQTEDLKEAITAQMQKRPPTFKNL